jgi:hypothetical protein
MLKPLRPLYQSAIDFLPGSLICRFPASEMKGQDV